MNLQPLFDNIVLKKQATKETESGLFLSTSQTEKSNIGIVVAVPKNNQMQVCVGQSVLFYEFASIVYTEENQIYYVVKQLNKYFF